MIPCSPAQEAPGRPDRPPGRISSISQPNTLLKEGLRYVTPPRSSLTRMGSGTEVMTHLCLASLSFNASSAPARALRRELILNPRAKDMSTASRV